MIQQLLIGGLIIALGFAACRSLLPLVQVRRARRRKTLELARGLPSAVVLLQIAIRSGTHPRRALASLIDLRPSDGPLHTVIDGIRDVHDRVLLGADLASAMLAAEHHCPELDRVLDVLRRAELDGGPVAVHLEVLLGDLRRHRRTSLDSAAQRLTVSMLFPLVVCILPAFVLLAVVPLVQSALSGLSG